MSFFLPRGRSALKGTPSGLAGNDHADGSKIQLGDKPESSSVINFYPHWCQCYPLFVKSRYVVDEPNQGYLDYVRSIFLCPPQGVLSRLLYFAFLNGLFFLFIWGLDHSLALDSIGSLIILELTGLTFGIFMKMLGLPALLAPLLIGIALNNIPGLNFFDGLHRRGWIDSIREIALCIIITRAGVELSPKQLKRLKGIVPLAAFGPCLVEACVCAGLMYSFFGSGENSMPIAMCFVAGFALSAVSPAVVVPGMLSLKRKRYGVTSGLPTLLIAASSIDDVLAISAFSISLSFVTVPGKPTVETWKIYAGIGGVVVGSIHGLCVGIILHFIPSGDMGKGVPYFRLVILLFANLSCVLMYHSKDLKWLSGAGTLGALTTAFIASFGWRSVRGHSQSMKKIENALAHMWTLMVPMLFGTIGNEINIAKFNWNVVGIIVAVIVIALIIRCLIMFFIVCTVNTTYKERLFCALSWMPKATVQAALAPLVVSEFEETSLKEHAQSIVLLAVVGILLTAPSGAIAISTLGPRLLTRADEDLDGIEEEDDVREVKINALEYENSTPEISGLAPDNE